jgi:hypothetical protein
MSYENWEDDIRRTFIELADYMNNHSNPLDYLIECCEDAVNTGHWKLDKFTVLNAKDELLRLRQSKQDIAKELFTANQEIISLYYEKN